MSSYFTYLLTGLCLDIEPTFEVIITQPQQQVVAGSDAQLSCNARGNQAQVKRMEWTRDGAELPDGEWQ